MEKKRQDHHLHAWPARRNAANVAEGSLSRLEKTHGAVIISRTLKTWGLSEARVDELVGTYMSQPNPTLALYAKPDGIQLRITAKAADRTVPFKLIHERENELRGILKEHIWGSDNDTLEEVLSRLIQNKGLTLASAESFTGAFYRFLWSMCRKRFFH